MEKKTHLMLNNNRHQLIIANKLTVVKSMRILFAILKSTIFFQYFFLTQY